MGATVRELANLASGRPEGKMYVRFMGVKIPIDLTYLKVKVVIQLAGFSEKMSFPEEDGKLYINFAKNYPVLIDYVATGLANGRRLAKYPIRRALRQMNNKQLHYLFDMVERLKDEERFFFAYQLIKRGKYLIISKSDGKPSLEG